MSVAAGTHLFRLNLRRYPDPAYFGRGALHRFDAPDSSFGVCYLGTSLDCCFLEVLRRAHDPATGARLLTLTELREYYAATGTVVEPLVLAHFADDGLARAGIDVRVTGGDDYDLSQAWSTAIHAHAGIVDGIFYPVATTMGCTQWLCSSVRATKWRSQPGACLATAVIDDSGERPSEYWRASLSA